MAHEAVIMALVVIWRLDCTSNMAELLCVFSQLDGCTLPLTQGQKLLSKRKSGLHFGVGKGLGVTCNCTHHAESCSLHTESLE